MGAMAFDSASRSFLTSSETKTEVLNNSTYILDHLAKNVSLGIGDSITPAIGVAGNTITIRQDIDAATGLSNDTPGDASDDRTVVYVFDTTTGIITFNDGNSGRDLVDNSVISATISRADNGLSLTNFTLRYRADENANAQINPEVTIDSQFFYPLCQSSG